MYDYPNPRGYCNTYRILLDGGTCVNIRFIIIHWIQVFGIEYEHVKWINDGEFLRVGTSIVLLYIPVDGHGRFILYFEGHGQLHSQKDECGGTEETIYGVRLCWKSICYVLVRQSNKISGVNDKRHFLSKIMIGTEVCATSKFVLSTKCHEEGAFATPVELNIECIGLKRK